MAAVDCVVNKIIYQNKTNGFTVMAVNIKNKGSFNKAVGYFPNITVGRSLRLEGTWKKEKRGLQFNVDKWEEIMPDTNREIERYLASGLIKGIGPALAKRIVSRFGDETFFILDNEPERLMEVSGLGSKKYAIIHESWTSQRFMKDLMIFLQGLNIGNSLAIKIYKEYGERSISIIKKNPYRLAEDIVGIGFGKADEAARRLGFSKESELRSQNGILYSLKDFLDEGHVYAERDQLVIRTQKLLNVGEAIILNALSALIAQKKVIEDDGAIYLPAFFYAEKKTAKLLVDIAMAENPTRDKDVDIEEIQKMTQIIYDETQANAIQMAIRSKVMILTGGPGTGKTTTIKGILQFLQTLNLKILQAAPTGRAAKRMEETTGLKSETIHRLLEYNPNEGFCRNESNPLDGDVLIVDEASMLDAMLMYSLVKAIPKTMKLIIIGDVDQLPSVSAGNVLKDLIDSECFPVVQLNTVHRQGSDSGIIDAAYRIHKGEYPLLKNKGSKDFFFITENDPVRAAEVIVDLVKDRLPKHYGLVPEEIQVLTPMRRGAVGATELNIQLQAALNHHTVCIKHNGVSFYQGDKVMQIKNDYDRNIFNGDIGFVESLNLEDGELTVRFGNQHVKYTMSELDGLVHAYATTIHKAQGSEYPVVVMPVLMNHQIMLERNLIYTGITRAKKMLIMIGTTKALSWAIWNVAPNHRNTKLNARLRHYCQLSD